MRHGHASLGLQARPGVGARVRCLGQGWGLGLDREKLYKGLELLVISSAFYSNGLGPYGTTQRSLISHVHGTKHNAPYNCMELAGRPIQVG